VMRLLFWRHTETAGPPAIKQAGANEARLAVAPRWWYWDLERIRQLYHGAYGPVPETRSTGDQNSSAYQGTLGIVKATQRLQRSATATGATPIGAMISEVVTALRAEDQLDEVGVSSGSSPPVLAARYCLVGGEFRIWKPAPNHGVSHVVRAHRELILEAACWTANLWVPLTDLHVVNPPGSVEFALAIGEGSLNLVVLAERYDDHPVKLCCDSLEIDPIAIGLQTTSVLAAPIITGC